MAALQGAFGSAAPAAPPPVPSGKPKVWKRPVAAEPAAAEPVPEKPKSKWVVEEAKDDNEGRVEKSGEDFAAPILNEVTEGEVAHVEAPALEEDTSAADEPAEDDEEAAEKARRYGLMTSN